MKINKPISFAQWKNPIIFDNNSVNNLWELNTMYGIDVEAELIRTITQEIDREIIIKVLELANQNTELPVVDDRLISGIPSEYFYEGL